MTRTETKNFGNNDRCVMKFDITKKNNLRKHASLFLLLYVRIYTCYIILIQFLVIYPLFKKTLELILLS